MYVRRAGSCTHPQAMTERGAPWRARVFPSYFGIVVHRTRGVVLFDTGYAPRFLDATHPFPERAYRWLTPPSIDADETALAHVRALGIDPQTVSTIVLSHLHADHVAGVRDFPKARLVYSRDAWQANVGRSRIAGVSHGFLRELLPADAETRTTFVEDAARETIEAPFDIFGDVFDIFGDRSAFAITLAGHCPGHIGLHLPRTPNGPTFFIGDAAWSHDAYKRFVPPPTITTSILGSTKPYHATLRAIGALHRAAPNIRIIPSHAPLPSS